MSRQSGASRTSAPLSLMIRVAIANLRFKQFRTGITLLGIIIGIGAIYLLLSFGIGLQQLVEGQLVGNKTINTVDVSSLNSKIVTLTPDNIGQIEAVSHVTGVSGVYTFASKVTLDNSTTDTVAYGIDTKYLEVTDFSLAAGELLDPTNQDEVLINRSLLQLIGFENERSSLGKTLNLTVLLPNGEELKKDLQITGVTNSNNGSELFMSADTFATQEGLTFAMAKVVVDDRLNIPETRWQIESLGYETTSPIDTIDQINDVFRFFNFILVGLGSVGLVIAALGMINTLTVSLLERTREIALMMTIGGRPRDMRRLFTIEALLLSLVGGIIGMLLATLVGLAVDLVLNQMAQGRGASEGFHVFAASPLLIIGMLALMVVIGLLVSFLPARRAARINPVEALRQE